MNRALALFLFALLACDGGEQVVGVAEDRTRRLLLEREEKEVVATLALTRHVAAKARSVTLYRVAQSLDEGYEQIEKAAKQKVAGYPVLKQASLTNAEAAPLVQLLTRRDTYFPPGDGWTCIFEPHHILQMVGDGKTVTIVICVGCGDVQFFTGREDPAAMKSVYPASNDRLSGLLDGLLKL